MQLNWIVLYGGYQLAPAQQQALAGAIQTEWCDLLEQQKTVVSVLFVFGAASVT